MKKAAVLLLVILLCAPAFARAGRGRAAPKPKIPESYDIAVCVTGELNESEKAVLSSWVFHALVKSGRFTAAERAAAFTAEIGNAQVTQENGIVDDGYIGRTAKQFGIRYVCVVGVASFSSYYSVSARILNSETAKITASGRVYGELNSTQALEQLALDVVTEMGVGWYNFAPLNRSVALPGAPAATPPSTPPPAVTAAYTPPSTPPSTPPPPAATPPNTPPTPSAATPPSTPPPPAVTAAYTPPADSAQPAPPAPADNTPPLPLEDIGASILIHTTPPEADVYIGERFIGKTNQPDKLLMPIGTHDVKFVKGDFEKTEAMTFQPGENTMKVIQLDDGKPKKKSKPKG